MTDLGDLVYRLRNTSVREIIRAVEKDGFSLKRETSTGARIYSHADGRLTVIHYHHGGDTLTRKTLRSVLQALQWTEDDLKRLGLLR
jgi:predicted RNA binding protein YcfA (HicA-like mRNA interferase family)